MGAQTNFKSHKDDFSCNYGIIVFVQQATFLNSSMNNSSKYTTLAFRVNFILPNGEGLITVEVITAPRKIGFISVMLKIFQLCHNFHNFLDDFRNFFYK